MKRRVPALASARTGITLNSGSICTDGTASRAAARMKACLKAGCAVDSSAQTNTRAHLHAGRTHLQVGRDHLAMADPAGDEHRHLGRRTAGSPAPGRRSRPARYGRPPPCPRSPAHPRRCARASWRAPATARSRPPWRRPPSAAAWSRAAAARRPARHGRPRASTQTSASSSSCGCMTIRLTPNGRSVSAAVAAISSASRSGPIEPQASTPKPPASLIAATRLPLGHPGHGTAQTASSRAEEAAGHAARAASTRSWRCAARHRLSPGRGRRRYAARAAPARCTPRRSAR